MTALEDLGPVPEANQPGHHPDVEQDKPLGPPPKPKLSRRFPFARPDLRLALPATLLGVRGDDAEVALEDDELRIRFGPWRLTTPIANVAGAEVTGPYQWWKVAGPPHLSLVDRGVTFATTTRQGVCIRFHEPVPGALPWDGLRHPGATVTVEDADELADVLTRATRHRAG